MSDAVGLYKKIAICISAFVLLLLVVFYWRSFTSDANEFADIVNKGNAFMEAECFKEAIDCYQRALEKEPGNERIVQAIIEAYMKMGEKDGDTDEAIISYLTAIAIRPDNRTAYWAIADIYERRGEYESLLDILQKGFSDTGDTTMEKKIKRIRNEKSIEKNEAAYNEMDEKERARREERANTMLGPLLEYFENKDYESLKAKLSEQNYLNFADEIIGRNFYYYGERDSYNNYQGIGLGAYENGYYYYGNYENNVRSGSGVWFKASYDKNSSIDFYIFEGQWADDAPNGDGIATTNYKSDLLKNNDFLVEVVEGNYTNGLENGTMTFTGTTKGKATQIFEYSIYDGVPQKIEDSDDGSFIFAKSKSGGASLTSDGSLRGVGGFDNKTQFNNDSGYEFDYDSGDVRTSEFGRTDTEYGFEDDNYVIDNDFSNEDDFFEESFGDSDSALDDFYVDDNIEETTESNTNYYFDE